MFYWPTVCVGGEQSDIGGAISSVQNTMLMVYYFNVCRGLRLAGLMVTTIGLQAGSDDFDLWRPITDIYKAPRS